MALTQYATLEAMQHCPSSRSHKILHRPFTALLLLLCTVTALPAADWELEIDTADLDSLLRLQYLNPAYHAVDDPASQQSSYQMPLGFSALLANPARNPFLYFLDRERFRRSFDLLSFYHQLLYPSFWLLDPAVSPERVELYLGAGGFELRDESGAPLQLIGYHGPWNASYGLTPLLPPPRIALQLRQKDWLFQLALFTGGGGISYHLNRPLAEYHEDGALEPETEYRLNGTLSYSAGLAGEISRQFTLPFFTLPGRLTWSPRLLVWHRAAFAEAVYSLGTRTDSSGTPVEQFSSLSLFSGYPGMGWGVGLRGDLGLLWEIGEMFLGASALNLIGLEVLQGAYGSDTDLLSGAPQLRFVNESPPGGMITGEYRLKTEEGWLHLSGAYGYIGTHLVRAAVSWNRPRWNTELRFRWNGTPELLGGFGVHLGRWRTTLSAILHPAPFTGETVTGIGLRIGRRP